MDGGNQAGGNQAGGSQGGGSRPGPAAAGIPDVIVEDGAWRRMVPRPERWVRRAAGAAGGHGGAVLLTSDGAVRRLNRTFRGQDKPTNVLTFDSGDVALAAGVVRREAAQHGRRVAHHLAHLVVHGVLHLRGLDHGGAGEARRMEMAEARILRRLGVPNPWLPRARPHGHPLGRLQGAAR